MKDRKESLKAELNNLNWLYKNIKDKEQDKVTRMFVLFNLASKLEYKSVEIGELEIAYGTIDLQNKILDFIIRSLRRK